MAVTIKLKKPKSDKVSVVQDTPPLSTSSNKYERVKTELKNSIHMIIKDFEKKYS